MATDYTHLTKLAVESKLSIGSPGSETDIMDSSGNLTLPTGTSISVPSVSASSKLLLTRTTNTSTGTINSLTVNTPFIKFGAGTATITINGIAAGTDGQMLKLYFSGGGTATITNQATAAATAARIITMTGANVATTGVGAAELIYDGAASRWILLFAST